MRALVIVTAVLVVGLMSYVGTQKPRLSLNSEQFGLMLLRGGYRSWFLRFSDGTTPDGKSVVIDEKAGTMRFGYRWWPTYSHVDIRKLKIDGMRIIKE